MALLFIILMMACGRMGYVVFSLSVSMNMGPNKGKYIVTPVITEVLYNLMEQSSSWKVARCTAIQEFPTFYGTLRYISLFIRVIHWPLS
jgi:hypothetical protein